MQARNHMKKLIKFSSKLPSWKTLAKRQAVKLDCITVTKILGCLRTSGCCKSRNRFKSNKIIVIGEYFDQQVNCNRCRRKMNQSRRSHLWRNQSYLPFFSKQMETINSWPRNLRTALEKYFRFEVNL